MKIIETGLGRFPDGPLPPGVEECESGMVSVSAGNGSETIPDNPETIRRTVAKFKKHFKTEDVTVTKMRARRTVGGDGPGGGDS